MATEIGVAEIQEKETIWQKNIFVELKPNSALLWKPQFKKSVLPYVSLKDEQFFMTNL